MKKQNYILTKFAGPNLTKFGTKHPWVKEFKDYSNKDHSLFQRDKNTKNERKYIHKIEKYFSGDLLGLY